MPTPILNPISVANAAYKGNKLYEEQFLDPNSTGNQKVAGAVQKVTDGAENVNNRINQAIQKKRLGDRPDAQQGKQADAGELYNNENYGKKLEEKKPKVDSKQKAKEYDEQLVQNDANNTAADRGMDFAHGEEIIKAVSSMGAPKEVVDRIAKRSVADCYDKNFDQVNIKKDVINFHSEATANFKQHVAEAKQKNSAIEQVMAKAEATKDYDPGQSILEKGHDI